MRSQTNSLKAQANKGKLPVTADIPTGGQVLRPMNVSGSVLDQCSRKPEAEKPLYLAERQSSNTEPALKLTSHMLPRHTSGDAPVAVDLA